MSDLTTQKPRIASVNGVSLHDGGEMPADEKLRRYARIARETLDAERFEEFCARHLGHLDAVAHEFFATGQARDAVRQKVAALFPAHEVEEFTELFFGRIQKWRAEEGRG